VNTPTDVAQQALDAAGCDTVIGDLEEGSREAQVCLRAYRQCLMQLLRGAHWDFARAQVPMALLADATRQTPNVPTVVPVPWLYEYQYPIDCMKVRFVPWNPQNNVPIPPGNIVPPNNQSPLTTAPLPVLTGARLRPSRFLVSNDPNYPPPLGGVTWETQGISPAGRTVILSNVPQAMLIYTQLILYPSQWDSLFRAALVAYLAAEVALPLDKSKDKRVGMALRRENYAIVKSKLEQARVSNGNESWSSSDFATDWIRARRVGWGSGDWGAGYGEPGILGGGWDYCGGWDSGSAY
jgi:hypothetical protein